MAGLLPIKYKTVFQIVKYACGWSRQTKQTGIERDCLNKDLAQLQRKSANQHISLVKAFKGFQIIQSSQTRLTEYFNPDIFS